MTFGVCYRKDQSHRQTLSRISMMEQNIPCFASLVGFCVGKLILQTFLSLSTLTVCHFSILPKLVYGQYFWLSMNYHQLPGKHLHVNVNITYTYVCVLGTLLKMLSFLVFGTVKTNPVCILTLGHWLML